MLFSLVLLHWQAHNGANVFGFGLAGIVQIDVYAHPFSRSASSGRLPALAVCLMRGKGV